MLKIVHANGGKAFKIGLGADANNISSTDKEPNGIFEPYTFNFDINEDAMFYALCLLASVTYNICKKN